MWVLAPLAVPVASVDSAAPAASVDSAVILAEAAVPLEQPVIVAPVIAVVVALLVFVASAVSSLQVLVVAAEEGLLY